MICSPVNLDSFIRPSLPWAGLELLLKAFQGVTSGGVYLAVVKLRPREALGVVPDSLQPRPTDF